MLEDIYKTSLCLHTDLYQLTMSYGYLKSGIAEREAVFHMFFRKSPFNGAYAVFCGLEQVVEYLQQLTFTDDDLEYLRGLNGADSLPLFDDEFLSYLQNLKITLEIDAVEEGTVVFANEPLIRVKGPLLQCQLVETAILNIINFQTLIATKASRMAMIASGEPILEFGLRRAQGIDGSISSSRAAYIGGCSATSNVLAGKILGIPVKGTHAHSWIMSFDTEMEAFEKYAEIMPNNCIFLVDTYDTLQGVKNAITVGKTLEANGHKMLGIRLDSGDLASLSIKARAMLDEAGFKDAAVVASNDLDEYSIEKLKKNGARVNVWGVGTKLSTAYDQPALGGVYKLSAIKDENGVWQDKLKLSEESVKTSNPGQLQVRRYCSAGKVEVDMIYSVDCPVDNQYASFVDDKGDVDQIGNSEFVDLLIPVLRNGTSVLKKTTLQDIQKHTQKQLDMFADSYRNIETPEKFKVVLEKRLHDKKQTLIKKIQQNVK